MRCDDGMGSGWAAVTIVDAAHRDLCLLLERGGVKCRRPWVDGRGVAQTGASRYSYLLLCREGQKSPASETTGVSSCRLCFLLVAILSRNMHRA